MKNFLFFDMPLNGNGRSILLFLLRLFIGVLMLRHGAEKLSSFSELSSVFPDPLGVSSPVSLILSIMAEVGCSVLLILGIFTRLAVLPLIFNMVIAVFVVHGGAAFQVKELAVIYLAIYVLFFFVGGERYSVDYIMFGGRQSNKV